jgi:hypothetical protein
VEKSERFSLRNFCEEGIKIDDGRVGLQSELFSQRDRQLEADDVEHVIREHELTIAVRPTRRFCPPPNVTLESPQQAGKSPVERGAGQAPIRVDVLAEKL